MCNKKHSCTHEELVNHSRHRYERLFFFMTSFLTVITFIVAIGLSVYKTETVSLLNDFAVQEYKLSNPDKADESTQEILASLSDDEKELIDAVDSLNPLAVMSAPLLLVLLMIYQIGKLYGGQHADGIRVTPRQFGNVHKIWAEMASELGMEKTPELYIQNGNGTLNAFATCVPGYRSFGVIYSDILERALANNDEKILRFILGHELGHVRLKHVTWWAALFTVVGGLPGLNYILGLPLSRAREYSCDKVGFALSNDNEQRGLIMLASGKHLYKDVDIHVYDEEHIQKRSLWATLNNFFGDHPSINWRIAALKQKRHGDLFWASKQNTTK